jgi:hypothetical protein
MVLQTIAIPFCQLGEQTYAIKQSGLNFQTTEPSIVAGWNFKKMKRSKQISELIVRKLPAPKKSLCWILFLRDFWERETAPAG